MALTKEQLIARFLPKVLNKRRNNLVWGDVVSAVATASTAEKESIVTALKDKNFEQAGILLGSVLINDLTSEATSSLETAFANNSLTIAELSEIFE